MTVADHVVDAEDFELVREAPPQRSYEFLCGDLAEPDFWDEQDADNAAPRTEYGLSKLVGERLTKAFARQHGIGYSIWCPLNIITPHERAEDEQGISHVFTDFIKHIVMEKRDVVPIIGDGEQIRCFTWIDDVASGIARHSFTPALKG